MRSLKPTQRSSFADGQRIASGVVRTPDGRRAVRAALRPGVPLVVALFALLGLITQRAGLDALLAALCVAGLAAGIMGLWLRVGLQLIVITLARRSARVAMPLAWATLSEAERALVARALEAHAADLLAGHHEEP